MDDDLQASDLLTRFVNDELDPARQRRAEDHLASCAACRDWVSTYGILAESLAVVAGSSEPLHLSSDELGTFALTADLLDDRARRRCAHHLETCSDCRDELQLVSAAVAEARDASLPFPAPPVKSQRFSASPRWLALAAALLVVIGGAATYYALSLDPEDYRLTGEIVSGAATVTASKSVVVEATEVLSGAELTLRSGGGVVFGDGVSVASGASLRVFVDGTPDS